MFLFNWETIQATFFITVNIIILIYQLKWYSVLHKILIRLINLVNTVKLDYNE